MIVADEGQGRDDARVAARLVGLTQMPESDWPTADAGLSGSMPALLIVEAAGVADAVLERVLPIIARLASEAGTAVVVGLDAGQIDLICALLPQPSIQLLVEPTLADRTAALVLARAGGSGGGSGGVRDPAGGEQEQLADLAREVARIAALLVDLTRRQGKPSAPSAFADRPSSFTAPSPDPGPAPVTAAQLRAAIRSRRLRDAEFGAGWFEDPAWDMLLDLYAAELEGARVSVSSLCIAAAVAPTTALRWIAKMTGAGLLVRQIDSRDRRRAFMALSDRSRAGMIRYCAAAKRAGAAIA